MFDLVTPHKAAIAFAITKFHDLARLEQAPVRIAAVHRKASLGAFLAVVSQAATVIEDDAPRPNLSPRRRSRLIVAGGGGGVGHGSVAIKVSFIRLRPQQGGNWSPRPPMLSGQRQPSPKLLARLRQAIDPDDASTPNTPKSQAVLEPETEPTDPLPSFTTP